jgi:hypothetical protein
VKTQFGVLRQEFLYRWGLVGGKIVSHDVDFLRSPRLAEQLGQKGDELGAGVPLGCLAFHFAGHHVRLHGQQIVFPYDPQPTCRT